MITAAGVVSPIGNDLEEVFDGIRTGRRGIGRIKSFDTQFLPSCLGAEVKEGGGVFQLEEHLDRKEVFLQRAMRELVEGKGLLEDFPAGKRTLHLGTGQQYFDLYGYARTMIETSEKWVNRAKDPYCIVRDLAREYGMAGGFSANVTTCVAASQAMGLSYRSMKGFGPGNISVTGGFDSVINPLHHSAFYKLGVQSDWEGEPGRACRPFDRDRRGLVLGEGAALFALKDPEDVKPGEGMAEITGYGSTMDAYKVTDPHPDGIHLAQSGMDALAEAGVGPEEIDCVHLHGTGTYKNALAETNAMKRIFPDNWEDIPVFSLKGQTGHLIGACGAVEMIGVLYSLKEQQVPATVNSEEPDPEVPLRVIRGGPLNMKLNNILKLNSAFGGQNTAFVVKRYVQ